MSLRVIYCALGCVSLLSVVQHKVLCELDSAKVVSLPNDALVALLIKQPNIPVLYFSQAEYDRAMRQLSPKETQAAVRKRLQYWTPNAAGQGINWIYRDARRSLALEALTKTSAAPGGAAKMEARSEQTLQFLAKLTGYGRFDGVSLASMIEIVVEGDVKLRNERLEAQDDAKHAGRSQEAALWGEAARISERYAQELGQSLKRLGKPEYAQALPYIGLERGVFVRPNDPTLGATFRARHEMFADWKDGVVIGWPVREIPDLEKRGKTVAILYFNPGQLEQEMEELSTAQGSREFAERLEGGKGASVEERLAYLVELCLQQHLLRRNVLEHTQSDRESAAILERQVREEAVGLEKTLADHPVWLEPGDNQDGTAEGLRRLDDEMDEDLKLLLALSHAWKEAELAARFTDLAARKH